MKPLRLRLQAFGPYPRDSVVDFRPLRAGGLFLIHGPTGAGKTSILDGLCFALFGSASGGERASDALRSDRAANDLLTEAKLEFALGTDVYRVTREPKQEIAKKRGDGLKVSLPKGMLEKLARGSDGSEGELDAATWDLVASGDTKTTEAVVGLLGMNEDQFRQVVVLPQGQFRKFLSTGSTDREALLEQLFRSHRFRELCETMQKQADGLAKQISERRTKAAALLTSLEVATDADLDRLADEARARLSSLESGGPELDARHKVASDRLTAAKALAKANQELAVAEAKRRQLEIDRMEVEGVRKRLADERRARPAMEADRRVLEIESDIVKLGREANLAEDARIRAVAEATRSRELLEALEAKRPEVRDWESEKQKLEELLPKAARLLAVRDGLALARKELATRDTESESFATRLKSLKDSLPQLRKRIETLQENIARSAESADEYAQLKEDHKAATDLFKRLSEFDKKRELAATTQVELERTVGEWTTAQRDVTRMKLSYHQAQAARLAAELKDDAPCPVCGSTEHPKLAKPTKDVPTPEVLEAAEAELAKKTELRARATSRAETLSEEIRLATEEFSKSLTGSDETWKPQVVARGTALKTRIDAIEAIRTAAKETQSELSKARSERERVESEFTSLETKTAESAKARDEARSKVRDLEVRVTELEADVPADRRDTAALEAKKKTLMLSLEKFRQDEISARTNGDRASETGARATERAKTLTEQIVKRTSDLEGAIATRDTVSKQAGFSEIAKAREAAIPEGEVAKLDLRVRDFEADWARTDDRVQKLGKEVASSPSDLRDLATIETEFGEIDRSRTNQQAERLELARRISQLDAARERSKVAMTEILRLEERYRLIGRLADVSLGRPPNELRINFQRYVLASRLDEVLEQASRRLLSMSSGRFTLRRSTKSDDKRKTAGLDLEVEDAFTGTTRGTASLSGGEGFLASLALALGLADVVQMHLGGVRLEAVFVDEGFGTLDPESLELAMRVLADLQAGGRLVGIISHVPELRDQIARRLAVRKTVDGSEIAWETASI
ncbi:MAG: SMC family ATPase [Bdellovibrionota bacterium]